MQNLAVFVGWMVAVLIGLFGLVIVVAIATGKIKLDRLICEANGDASMARFQFLIFTFVIASSLLLIILTKGQFPDTIPGGILALLGISGGSYIVGKGITASLEKDQIAAKVAEEKLKTR